MTRSLRLLMFVAAAAAALSAAPAFARPTKIALTQITGDTTGLGKTVAGGSGMLTTSRDGDPSTVDVRGATDRYYGGVVTAAVAY